MIITTNHNDDYAVKHCKTLALMHFLGLTVHKL